MNRENNIKVPFDPGFAKYYPALNDGHLQQINHALSLKGVNQRKLNIRMLENSLLSSLKTVTCIYYSCVVYGSIIASKYKEPPATITDNHVSALPDSEKENIDLTLETKIVIEIYNKINKAVEFYFKRKSKLPENLVDCANTYIEFIELNNHLKDLKTTDEIKLPEKTNHFRDYTPEKLNELEEEVVKIAQTGNLENIFNIS